MAHAHAVIPAPGKYVASVRTKTIAAVASFFGLLLFALALVNDPTRAWYSYLTSYFFFLNLALGGLFFAAIQHVAKAGWSVTVRRFAEAMTAFLPIAAVATIGLLFGIKELYVWLNPKIVAADPLIQGKVAYLNMPFFVIRLAVCLVLWLLFKKLIVGNSLKQDEDGKESHSVVNVGISVAFLLVFAISYSFFSVDLLMSLQPHWFSTIWGVYNFAGLFQSSLAVLVIITVAMMRKGLVRGLVSHDHLHDLGKFLKAFTVFYAYIGFSQFILIWYANLPEETIFYLARSGGGWMAATLSLLVLKFMVPFLLLLPKAAKRNPTHLVLVSILIIIMQYVDIHWMTYPNLVNDEHWVNFEKYHGGWIFSWQELGGILLFGGLFIFAVTNFLSKHNLVPIKDPRLEEAVNHHVTY